MMLLAIPSEGVVFFSLGVFLAYVVFSNLRRK